MTHHCGGCTYFGDEEAKGFHRCNLIDHLNHYKRSVTIHSEEAQSADFLAKSGVIDGSGYFAALVVREDFGCVDFKEKSSL